MTIQGCSWFYLVRQFNIFKYIIIRDYNTQSDDSTGQVN